MKLRNDYMSELGTLYAAAPKAVFAAIAVSYATCGGDYIERAHENVLCEWPAHASSSSSALASLRSGVSKPSVNQL
jgi:hypothetical protein